MRTPIPRGLRGLHRVLFRLHRLALRRPRATLVVAAVIVAAAGTRLPAMQVRLSIAEVEDDFPSVERNRALRERFGGGHSVFVVLAPGAGLERFEKSELEAIRSWLERERAENEELVRVASPFGIGRLRWEGARPRLEPLLADGDPDPGADPAGLAALRDSPWHGVLTDTAATDVGIELAFRDTPGGSRYGKLDPAVVGRLRESLAREFGGGDVATHLTGPATFLFYSLQGIERFRILNVAVLVALLLLFRLLLGTWRSGGLVIGLLVVAGVIVYAAMSVAGAPIDLLSTGLFLMISVAALSDYLFLSWQQLGGARWRHAFHRMLLPSFFTSLTTIVGFGSLAVSDLEIIRRFGTWAAFGALVEWVVTFLLLPAFLKLARAGPRWTDRDRAWRPALPERLVGISPPRTVILLLMAAYAVAAAGAWSLNTSDSLVRLFPAGHPYRQAFDYLERSRGWLGSISLVFADADDRATNERVLERVAQLPNVKRVVSPWAVLDFVAGDTLGDSSRLLEHAGRFPDAYRGLFAGGQARASVYLEDVSLHRLAATLRAIDEIAGSAAGTAGELVTYAEFAGRVPTALFRTFAVCLLLIATGLLLLLRAAGHARRVRVLLAVFWGPAFMMAVLWIAQVPVNFLTCVFASVLVGLTGDNAIQYVFAGRRGRMKEGIARRGGASIQVAFVMALVCLTFLGSAFVPSRILGTLLGAGFLASLVGDLWILKELVDEPA